MTNQIKVHQANPDQGTPANPKDKVHLTNPDQGTPANPRTRYTN
nr:hypothetical protein [Mycoplasmopsis bovis]